LLLRVIGIAVAEELENLPMIQTLRIYDDVFFPASTTDMQKASHITVREWMNEVELKSRAAVENWDQDFVDAVLKTEGRSAFDDSVDQLTNVSDIDKRKGLYEVLHTFSRAVNEDGVPGIYVWTWSDLVDKSCAMAGPRQLFSRKHGMYPFVFGSRETLTSRLIDSRGIPELVQTDQEILKLFRDSYSDYTQKQTNPPIRRPPGSVRYQLALAPFGEIPASRRDDVSYLEPPPYPAAADKIQALIKSEVEEYCGIPSETTPPLVAQVLTQMLIDSFLGMIGEVLTMTVQLIQELMPDEILARITNSDGLPILRNREEIQGRYDIHVAVDVRDFEQEYLLKKAEIALKYVRPLDVRGELPWTVFARSILAGIDPNWAAMIPDSGVNQKRIVDDEASIFVGIVAGVEPEYPEQVDAPDLRLGVIEKLIAPRQQAPQAFGQLSPASQAILQKRIEYLNFQKQQAQNAITGRTGVQPVTPEIVEESNENGQVQAGV